MGKAVFKRRGNSLVAVDAEGLELLAPIRDGREVMVSVKVARNPKHHRLLMAMLGLIVKRAGAFDNHDNALVALKVACGLVDPYIDAQSGKTYFVPRSIAFESMSQDKFIDFFDRAVFVITTRWFPPGTKEEDVRAELERMAEPNFAPSIVPDHAERETADG